jgi:Fe2+ transport system protein FeoA
MEKRKQVGDSKLPLSTLMDGETGIITSISTGHGKGHGKSRGLRRRLMDMGLTPGTEVKVVKTTPFHGPLEITVRGSRLALGRGIAKRIFVVMKSSV